MKKIKKIVLRSATELTNSEMKKLRGGYDPGNNRPSSCIIPCPDGFGGGSVELDCSEWEYCDVYSGVGLDGTPFYGAGCYTPDGVHDEYSKENLCGLTELLK